MIDTGAKGYVFIDISFAQHHIFALHHIAKRETPYGCSGYQDSNLGNHVFAAEPQVGTINKEFNTRLFATKIGTYPINLSMPCART